MPSIVCFPGTHLQNHVARFDMLIFSLRGVKQVLQCLLNLR